MSGETEKDISGWTTDTLKEHIVSLLFDLSQQLDQRFVAQNKAVETAMEAQEKAVAAAISAADRAVTKAEIATDKRFEAVNEFRGQLADQTAEFVRRVEVEPRFSAIIEKIDDLGARMNRADGNRFGQRERRETTMSSATLLVSIIATILVAVGVVVTAIIATRPH